MFYAGKIKFHGLCLSNAICCQMTLVRRDSEEICRLFLSVKIYDLYDYICHIISGTKFNMAIIHIKTVPPNNILFGGTVPPNNFLFGGTVPPNNFLFGGTVPPNSFPQQF